MKPAISKLHYITTSATLAEQACLGGVDWIQLRMKNVSYEDYRAEALKVQAVCKKYGAKLIINDNAALALDIKADGVHIGKEDVITTEEEAALLEGGYIIGCTTNTIDDILHLCGKPIDYVGLGPFRFTTTKENLSPILGIDGYRKIFNTLKEKDTAHPPVIGIGGVTEQDIKQLLGTGLHGVAVSGAITNAADVQSAAKNLKNITER